MTTKLKERTDQARPPMGAFSGSQETFDYTGSRVAEFLFGLMLVPVGLFVLSTHQWWGLIVLLVAVYLIPASVFQAHTIELSCDGVLIKQSVTGTSKLNLAEVDGITRYENASNRKLWSFSLTRRTATESLPADERLYAAVKDRLPNVQVKVEEHDDSGD